MIYKTRDIILPDMRLQNPCPIEIEITGDKIKLRIDNRDWSWDAPTGDFIGQGSTLKTFVKEEETK